MPEAAGRLVEVVGNRPTDPARLADRADEAIAEAEDPAGRVAPLAADGAGRHATPEPSSSFNGSSAGRGVGRLSSAITLVRGAGFAAVIPAARRRSSRAFASAGVRRFFASVSLTAPA